MRVGDCDFGVTGEDGAGLWLGWKGIRKCVHELVGGRAGDVVGCV